MQTFNSSSKGKLKKYWCMFSEKNILFWNERQCNSVLRAWNLEPSFHGLVFIEQSAWDHGVCQVLAGWFTVCALRGLASRKKVGRQQYPKGAVLTGQTEGSQRTRTSCRYRRANPAQESPGVGGGAFWGEETVSSEAQPHDLREERMAQN